MGFVYLLNNNKKDLWGGEAIICITSFNTYNLSRDLVSISFWWKQSESSMHINQFSIQGSQAKTPAYHFTACCAMDFVLRQLLQWFILPEHYKTTNSYSCFPFIFCHRWYNSMTLTEISIRGVRTTTLSAMVASVSPNTRISHPELLEWERRSLLGRAWMLFQTHLTPQLA